MTIDDFYRVWDDKEDVIIGKDTQHGFNVMYIGKLQNCENRYMNCVVNRIKEWQGGIIIKI